MPIPPKSPRRPNATDISDKVVTHHLPPYHEQNRRSKASSDVIAKSGNATILHDDDLKLAEKVSHYGTSRERAEENLTDPLSDVSSVQDAFQFNLHGLSSSDAAQRLSHFGKNQLPEVVESKLMIFLRQFYAPMPTMIWIAIVVELLIGNYLDMCILLTIQFANASISFYEVTKAGNAVAALKSSLKPTATCKRDGRFQVLDASLLVPGDTVLLASGSAVPADCRINESTIDVDQSALTGESLPVSFYQGDSVKMGSTVVRGEVQVSLAHVSHQSILLR
jgi:magnesium-transporting ATPase (P-type)